MKVLELKKMSSVKHLVYAVIRFLREQSQMDAYTSDEQESLEGRHLFLCSFVSYL